MRIGLVGCVKSKLDKAAPARDLYISALFRGARCSVERSCDRWFILSAEHALVHPDAVVAPYEKTLKDVSPTDRREWSERVLTQLQMEIGDLSGHAFEIHAGAAYANFGLVEGLRHRGAGVEQPLEGLSLGQRLAHYKRAGCL
jgi:hypothetical protein